MSFSSDVKDEIARILIANTCCLNAEISALLRMGGSVVIKNYTMGVDFSTENAALARRVLQFVKTNFKLPIEVMAVRSKKLRKKNRYTVKISPSKETEKFIHYLGILPDEESLDLERRIMQSFCCRKAFLRGAFLAGGSVSKPTSNYHLEIVSQSKDLSSLILKLMKSMNLSAKITDRKGNYIVYIKAGDAITSFLSIIGAHSALMDFENIRIVKDMRNQANRVVNCETSNLNKVVDAALKQTAIIEYLKQTSEFDKLSPVLQEAAELRLNHPEESIAELAKLARGNVGKAGMNHRFRKMQNLAKDLGMTIDEN